jgi:hypothetical protein
MKTTKVQREAMKRWRSRNPDYMKRYYASNPKQYQGHKRLMNKWYYRMKEHPRQYAKYLKKNRENQRKRYWQLKQLNDGE